MQTTLLRTALTHEPVRAAPIPGAAPHATLPGLEAWSWDGNAEAPTFSPSINIVGRCHYFIRAGMIEFCGDSRHHLAGHVVPLPDIPGWTNERSDHDIS